MASKIPQPLKLLALDHDDLKILSAHLQDAVLRMADLAYLPAEERFVAVLNRFDWMSVDTDSPNPTMRRCRCALRLDRVKRAQLLNVTPGMPSAVAELLAVTYEETDPPGGFVTLVFAGGGAIRLEVECIEADLRDLGTAWQTQTMPRHDDMAMSIVDTENNPKV